MLTENYDRGLHLAQAELFTIIMRGQIEKAEGRWTYRLGGQIRAVLGVRGGSPEGDFKVLYPNGVLWIAGRYDHGCPAAGWRLFRPDGSEIPEK